MASGPLFRFALFLLILASVLGTSSAGRCCTSSDCNDNKGCTIDFCEPVLRQCINIPKRLTGTACMGKVARRTRADLLIEIERTTLNLEERLQIINVAITLVRDIHPHRILHKALLGVDPVPQLIKFRDELIEISKNPALSAITVSDFHQRMKVIFTSIDDRHSSYRPPPPLQNSIALLGFTFREFYDAPVGNASRVRRFAVKDVAAGLRFRNTKFTEGVEIISWNGVPIEDAIRASGEAGFGNNRDSKLLRGIRWLTARLLALDLFPETDRIIVGFRFANGAKHFVSVPWLFATMPLNMSDEMLNGTRNEAGARVSPKVSSGTRTKIPVKASVSGSIGAEIVQTKRGPLGVITFFNFNVLAPNLQQDFFAETARLLLTAVPQNGVIVDIRGNDGGTGEVCQNIPQLFINRTITPVGVTQRVTPLTVKAAPAIIIPFETPEERAARLENIALAVRIGDPFFPRITVLTELVNNYTGPRYMGPVIVVSDAETYSCGDVFASNVQDNGAALLVGVHDFTGGGGSTTAFNTELLALVPDGPFALPKGVRMRISTARLERAGKRSGVNLEFFGVSPDVRYFPTKRDVVFGDVDFFEFLHSKLAELRA